MDYGTLYTSRYKILRAAYAAWRRQCAGQHGCAHYYPDAYYAFTLENEAGWRIMPSTWPSRPPTA